MGQNKKRTRKSNNQRAKPIQGNRANSTNAKKSRAKNSSAKKSPTNKAPLVAHLEKFAKAVADDHSHVKAAILAGRAPGSASFLYRQPGVKDRIAELLTIKKKATEEEVAKECSEDAPCGRHRRGRDPPPFSLTLAEARQNRVGTEFVP